MLVKALEAGDIFYKPIDILPFLQTALMDEKILEVVINGMENVYFNRLHDHLPPLEEKGRIELILETTPPAINSASGCCDTFYAVKTSKKPLL